MLGTCTKRNEVPFLAPATENSEKKVKRSSINWGMSCKMDQREEFDEEGVIKTTSFSSLIIWKYEFSGPCCTVFEHQRNWTSRAVVGFGPARHNYSPEVCSEHLKEPLPLYSSGTFHETISYTVTEKNLLRKCSHYKQFIQIRKAVYWWEYWDRERHVILGGIF